MAWWWWWWCPSSWLWYWSAEARARRARGSVAGALARLRASQREIDGNIKGKQRRVRDFDGTIMEIGLRRRGTRSGTLPDRDRAALRYQIQNKRLYAVRIDRFYGLLRTVDQQIALLEDASTLGSSIAAIRGGAAAQTGMHKAGGISPEEVEDMLERVSEQQALAADTQQRMLDHQAAQDSMEGMTDAALEHELAELMDNDEFTGQFDPQDVTRVQQDLADAPDVPLLAPALHAALQLPDTL